jgi:hypothetical protein
MEPKDKRAKDAGELSETAKTHLISEYNYQMFGRRREIEAKQISKGNMVEADSMAMVSRIRGIEYVKNEERRSNEWITGLPDSVSPIITDYKNSWDLDTFTPHVVKQLDPIYEYQMQGYLWLWDQPEAEVIRCLMSAPEALINAEKRKLLFSMDVISDESEEYLLAAQQLEFNMVFDDIDEKLRIISKKVRRNDEIIAKIPEKVEKARDFLTKFHQRYLDPGSFVDEEVKRVPKEGKTQQVSATISTSSYKYIEEAAEKDNLSLSQVIDKLIQAAIKEKTRRKKGESMQQQELGTNETLSQSVDAFPEDSKVVS